MIEAAITIINVLKLADRTADKPKSGRPAMADDEYR
jgi:hypothetical protein